MQLNEQQLQVVNSNANKIVCIASAGAGKTSVLLQRIKRLISEGVRADSILVLTFTNAAAQELTDRFKRDNPDQVLVPEFKTFHAFCYSLIAKDRNIRWCLGYSDIPNIATEEDIRKIWNIVKVSCNIKLSDKQLYGDRSNLSMKQQFEYDVFWKEYKKLLCKENLITFDILCYDVSQMFVDNLDIVAEYKRKYEYVYQDESQDTDTKQMAFVQSFTNSKLYVCGDPQQMLYRFRGCTNELIKGLAENPEWELIKLPYNYRSTKQIVDFSNKIFATKWAGSKYYLAGQTDKDGDPIHFCGEFPEKVTDLLDIATGMQAKINEGKSVAILCRTNAEVAEIRSMFGALNIPTKGKADNSDIVGILKSSISSEECVKWIAGMLPNEEYVRYLRMSTLDPSINEEQTFLQNFGVKYVRLLDKVFKCRTLLSANKLPSAMIIDVLNFLKLKCELDMDIFMQMNLQDGIEYVTDLVERSVNSGVYIGTIHSVKGLEYDIVHVVHVDSQSFNTTKSEDEMACFYVACTRAKEQLYLWYDREADDGYSDGYDGNDGSHVKDFYHAGGSMYTA